MEAARAAARTGVEGASGAAAARAALANARGGGAAPPAGRAAPSRPAGAGGGAARSWSDAPPVEEAPFDPEYDGPAAAYEGFDPGDEPLDEVIDEKTARQSSEEQAIQLLREAFGAEKIAEL
jgi:DNA polymerase-3 subunit gamma/tau